MREGTLDIAANAAGQLLNIGQQGKQRRHQEKLMNMQLGNQKKLNQQGYDLGVKMFEATGFGAQKNN